MRRALLRPGSSQPCSDSASLLPACLLTATCPYTVAPCPTPPCLPPAYHIQCDTSALAHGQATPHSTPPPHVLALQYIFCCQHDKHGSLMPSPPYICLSSLCLHVRGQEAEEGYAAFALLPCPSLAGVAPGDIRWRDRCMGREAAGSNSQADKSTRGGVLTPLVRGQPTPSG